MEAALTGKPILLFIWTLLKLGVLSILFAELLARAGMALFPPRKSPLESFGIALPAGVALLGTALLGLACTGLLFRPAAPLLAAALAAASWRRWGKMPLAVRALREAAGAGLGPAALAALAALPLALLVAVPYVSPDARIYHLGAPSQFLVAHRILLQDVPFPFHFALPLEMCFLVPLWAGEPRLASALSALCLASLLAVFAARRTGPEGRVPALLGAVLALTLAPVLSFTAGGKNDVAAAAFVAAGAVLARAGSWRPAAFLLGLGTAAKYTCAPAAACVLLFFRPPRGTRLASLVLFAVPALPWLAKAALATGDPVFPFLSTIFPSPDWGPANSSAYQSYLNSLQDPRTFRPGGLPVALLETVAMASLPAALLLPGALAAPATRRTALAGLAGVLATLAAAHDPRYALPSLLILALACGEWAGGLAGRARRFVVPVTVVACLTGVPFNPSFKPGRLANAGLPLDSAQARETTTLAEAMEAAGRAGFRRILLAGESSSFSLPARAVSGFLSADTPFLWRAAREARTPGELAIKYRQKGIDGILYNYVSADWRTVQGARAFPWDERMLALHEGLVRSRFSPAWRSDKCDFIGGGFVLYRLFPRTPARLPAAIPFLPGTEAVTHAALLARAGGDDAGAAREYAALSRTLPRVLALRAEAGACLIRTGDWAGALLAYSGPARNDLLFWRMSGYGAALTQSGDYDGARAVLRRDLARYPFDDTMLRLSLAEACRMRGGLDTAARRFGPAREALREGAEALAGYRDGTRDGGAMRAKLAIIRGMQGDNERKAGDRAKAAGFYREAIRLGAGMSERIEWQKNLEAVGKGR